ncbi:MAG: TIGR03790 family protein [Burkholderiaceae bacterium]
MPRFFSAVFFLVLLCARADAQALASAKSGAPIHYGLLPENVAVVINDDEPNSVAIGEYYREARKIPEKNIVHVQIPNRPSKLTLAEFDQLKQRIDAQLHPEIQAIVMVWTAPYAVECNSITSALTLGFNAGQCEKVCGPGKLSRYFDSKSVRPFDDFEMRLSMLLPTDSVEQAKALIDRGVLSSLAVHPASAYFLITSDVNRNTRAKFFPPSGVFPQKKLVVRTLHRDDIADAKDVMFYLTGTTSVSKLATLHFMPGALADHLTSTGGDLLGKGQMSSLRWLEAGATASYGTVSEPCNYWQKFPNPAVLLKQYLLGASAIEAYWKSVAWPAQGVFIGEPLASPYRR